MIFEYKFIDYPIQILNLPTKKEKQLLDKKITTIKEMLEFYPINYYDFRKITEVKSLIEDEHLAIVGKVLGIKKYNKCCTVNIIDKNNDKINLMFFNQNYIDKYFIIGEQYIFCGTYKIQEKENVTYKTFYPIFYSNKIEELQRIIPIYSNIRGMSNDYIIEILKKIFIFIFKSDYLEKNMLNKYELVNYIEKFKKRHFPQTLEDIEESKKRENFDILFEFHYKMAKIKKQYKLENQFKLNKKDIWLKIKEKLPFTLTTDQDKILNEMYDIMKKERLNALVQGDVGSGKTIVAIMLMALGIENNFQSCLIAPTEVLANQHYEKIKEIFKDFENINIAKLTGSLKKKEKDNILKELESGKINIVVGTHSIIQDSVKFNKLGIIVIDEQHKFGVKQREKLFNLKENPHMIIMSATPIPRTLSLALYGDYIKTFVIKSKPNGRKQIKTMIMQKEEEINKFMLKEIKKGRQCYIVCPFIEESESQKFKTIMSVEQQTKITKDFFKKYPEIKVLDISGKMKQELVDKEIEKFASKQADILISTTIIEVGIDVPNSTVIVLKNSERFGLAQAHQLRGRVGRGQHQSYCILQTNLEDKKAEILCSTTDGFKIAEKDLELRGSGDYLGIKQTGENKAIMKMIENEQLSKDIINEVKLIESDKTREQKYSQIFEI